MGKVMRHTLGASLNIRHNLSSSKGPKPLQLKLLTTYIPKDRKSGSAGMPRPISYAVFCLKKKKKTQTTKPHKTKITKKHLTHSAYFQHLQDTQSSLPLVRDDFP